MRRATDPVPYGNHSHASLAGFQQKAIEFGWPSVVQIVVPQPKKAKKDRRQMQREAEKAKREKNRADLDELFPSRTRSFRLTVPPPGGRITRAYVQGLIGRNDTAALEFIFKSDEWELTKWESEAWGLFMDWNTRRDA